MLVSSALAQNNTNSLPEMPAPVTSPAAETAAAPVPAPATNAPAAKTVKHHKHAVAHAKAPALKEPAVALVPGTAEVTVSNLVVRGQAGLKGETVAHVHMGDTVTVLSQINLDRHQPGEPAQWVKIALPTNVNVWVSAKYVDAANNVVTARRLNLRAGPGENYSVLGIVEKGDSITQITTKGGWMRIEAPTNAYAFVAAMYLNQQAAAVAVAPATTAPAETEPTPAPAMTQTTVPAAQPIVAEPNNVPTPAATTPATPVVTPAPEAIEPMIDTNITRVVSHEGVVRHVGSLITPTAYELYDPTTDNNIDFLYTTTTNLDLSRYVSMRIIVSGQEGLSERWGNIPVLTIQSIQVIDTNAVPQLIYRSPRASQRY